MHIAGRERIHRLSKSVSILTTNHRAEVVDLRKRLFGDEQHGIMDEMMESATRAQEACEGV
jgi:hypothetical protein